MTDGLALEASTARFDALTSLEQAFRAGGIENPAREARLSLCAASGVSPVALIVDPRQPLGLAASKVREVAARRAAGEPLSRIVGRREFWGLSLAITPHVLDPRPDTETVVEAALSILSGRRDAPLRILDLGVGSGAILCALLVEFGAARGVGVDISVDAANLAQANLKACGLSPRSEIQVRDWTRNLDGPFDLIVSNPPYIPTADLPGLPREVRDFDPSVALDGGSDGLAAYRRILPEARRLLAAGGRLLVELGAGQAVEVAGIAKRCGFAQLAFHRDLAGLDRVLAAGLTP
ncbi:MAG TPA: peptide chain release factor N(5)-glutamine methyltransferase [Roseiarcus sp.]|nr:peptide chain release factor N(5)-glutamine methyltransferase [Roseiarcus sp.]